MHLQWTAISRQARRQIAEEMIDAIALALGVSEDHVDRHFHEAMAAAENTLANSMFWSTLERVDEEVESA